MFESVLQDETALQRVLSSASGTASTVAEQHEIIALLTQPGCEWRVAGARPGPTAASVAGGCRSGSVRPTPRPRASWETRKPARAEQQQQQQHVLFVMHMLLFGLFASMMLLFGPTALARPAGSADFVQRQATQLTVGAGRCAGWE